MLETQRDLYENYRKTIIVLEKIPFIDLHAQYLSIRNEIDEAISDVISSSSFVRGEYVDKFERLFSAAIGSKHCVSCGNGTDSLYIIMRALDLNPGDEVIVPAHSWISTSETVTQAGGKVIFCDTDLNTFTIDPSDIRKKITDRTVGIIPVHLYGHPAEMDEIMAVADEHDLWVIEDCAQAHFAKYKGRQVGTFGVAGSFSFYPGKNLGAMGDAGAIVTDNTELAKRMAMFARHGGLIKGDHIIEGVNSRMDGLQAAILCAKLSHIGKWTALRRQAADVYTNMLNDSPSVQLPVVASSVEHVWHLYVIRHERRNQLAKHLDCLGISTLINYPVSLPFLPAYSRLAHTPDQFPAAVYNQSRILSIPLYPEMTLKHIERVVRGIKSFKG